MGSYGKLARLKEQCGTWENAWRHECATVAPPALTELDARGIKLVLYDDPGFPALLREMPHAPHAIYVKGTIPQKPLLAIVGTRKSTETGASLACAFSESFVRYGTAVVSGLAIGIDAAAHRGSLAHTAAAVAVLPCGIAAIYPRMHERLAERILSHAGAIVSEYPPDIPALPYRFLERNRIVSGLAKAVVVIEAPKRSGALATARYALEQNREVFVVPGPATHRNYAGSHALIRAGATLVTSPEQVLEDLGMAIKRDDDAAEESPDARVILAALRSAARTLSIDEIIERTTLTASAANSALSILLLDGAVEEKPGGYTI